MFEYASNVRMIDIDPSIGNSDGVKIGEIVNKQLDIIILETDKQNRAVTGDKWEIVSHSLLLLENHLVVSFLLRRPKKRLNKWKWGWLP